jgi:anthranilate synthase component 2
MFVVIDNYDSFVYNLVHYLGELGAETRVYRNNRVTVDEVLAQSPQGVILSPGPCDPDKAGICLEMVEKGAGKLPILGVCLGHQSIGQAFGGKVVRSPKMMHGKLSAIRHTDSDVFKGLPTPFEATRYHSLMVDRTDFPDCLAITAESDDGVVMGLAHKDLPVYGVQFHPESIASQHGHALLRNFLDLAAASVR